MTAKAHLSRLHNLPCVVCTKMGVEQSSPSVAHHVEFIRDAHSDFAAIPLCDFHHTGAGGVHHLSRREFSMRYKLSDVDLLALTIWEMDRRGMIE